MCSWPGSFGWRSWWRCCQRAPADRKQKAEVAPHRAPAPQRARAPHGNRARLSSLGTPRRMRTPWGVASWMGGPSSFVTIQCTACVSRSATLTLAVTMRVPSSVQIETRRRPASPPKSKGPLLAYGYLPENATAVVAVFHDGRRVDDDVVSKPVPSVVSNAAPRVWALPLPLGVQIPGAPPIFYVAADGTETPAPKI
jgi:hypothetical protein